MNEIDRAEGEFQKMKGEREAARKDLEQIKLKLDACVNIEALDADLEELEDLSKVLMEKDRELLEKLMLARDEAKKEWIKNWVDSEIHGLMRRDRDDVRNHIELYSNDLQKLEKIIAKFQSI